MLLVYYLTIINVLAFILYGIDKKKARDDRERDALMMMEVFMDD